MLELLIFMVFVLFAFYGAYTLFGGLEGPIEMLAWKIEDYFSGASREKLRILREEFSAENAPEEASHPKETAFKESP